MTSLQVADDMLWKDPPAGLKSFRQEEREKRKEKGEKMKTPERSCSYCVSQIVQTFCTKVPFVLWIERHTQIHYVTSGDVMTSYHDLT